MNIFDKLGFNTTFHIISGLSPVIGAYGLVKYGELKGLKCGNESGCVYDKNGNNVSKDHPYLSGAGTLPWFTMLTVPGSLLSCAITTPLIMAHHYKRPVLILPSIAIGAYASYKINKMNI